MNKKQETILDKPLGGLFLMILMTIFWTVIATIYIQDKIYYSFTCLFTIAILFFTYSYLYLNRQKRDLPPIQTTEDKKKERLYWIIFVAEGVAIFLAKNILLNIHQDNLFISIFALIVGLHFFPLAKVFDRKFDYYIGTWTTIIAIFGIVLTVKNYWTQDRINSLVCFGCAIATASYGQRMILEAKKILKLKK